MAAVYERRMVDEIRSHLNSADQTKTPALEDLARRYADACRTANERLARCSDFLEKGLRTQAIQIAEIEPGLLDVVRALSFPEVAAWQELSATYGLDRIPPLRIEVAKALGDAAVLESTLAPLLKQHRRLAVAQATVKEKLAVMRQIASIDKSVAYWRTDIAALEQHRVTELMGLARAVRLSGEVAHLKQIIAEFEAEQWHGDIPQELRMEFASLSRNLHERFTLPELAGQLVAAMQHIDVSRLGALRNRWNEVLQSIRKSDPSWMPHPNLVAMVRPPFAFLDQELESRRQNEFRRDVLSLEQAMRTESDEEQVERLLAKAEAHKLPFAPILRAEIAEYKYSAKEMKLLWTGVKVALTLAGITALIIGGLLLRDFMSKGS